MLFTTTSILPTPWVNFSILKHPINYTPLSVYFFCFILQLSFHLSTFTLVGMIKLPENMTNPHWRPPPDSRHPAWRDRDWRHPASAPTTPSGQPPPLRHPQPLYDPQKPVSTPQSYPSNQRFPLEPSRSEMNEGFFQNMMINYSGLRIFFRYPLHDQVGTMKSDLSE